MLVFKARPRKDPSLSSKLTPSQRRMMRTLREAREATQRALRAEQSEIIRLLLHAPTNQIIRAVPMGAWIDVQAELRAELQAELLDSGRRVKLPPIQKATINYKFDDARPEAAAWASKEAGVLIQDITQDQLNFVRDVVSRAEMGEFTPVEAARVFRQMEDGMGLTVQQSEWVENFRQQRITEGMSRGLSYEAAEVQSRKGTARYADRIYRYRTETIARTEIMRASNEGRNQAWAQGIEGGWIRPDTLKKWSVEKDGRECSICRPLGDLDPIPINASFPQGDPPVHPNCRCTVQLTDEIPQDLLDMTDDELEAEIDRLLDQRMEDEMLALVGEPRAGLLGPSVPDEAVNEIVDYEWEEDVDEWLDAVGVDPGPDRSMDRRAFDAWEDYGADGYSAMNARLRGGSVGDDATGQRIRDLAGYMRDSVPLRQNIRVFRGMRSVEGLSFEPGSTYVDPGFLSTSPIREVATQFARDRDPVLFRVTAMQGVRAVVGSGAGELEVMFAPGTPLHIIGTEQAIIDGQQMTIVHAEVRP